MAQADSEHTIAATADDRGCQYAASLPPPGWFALDVMRKDSRKWDWVARMVDVHPDETCTVDFPALFYLLPPTMSTKSRQTICGGQIICAKIRAESARKRAAEAAREADRAEAEAWSIQMEDYGGSAQPLPKIGRCLNGGYGWLEVECHRCKTRASIPLEAIRRPRDTPIWKLEAAPKCRSCRKGRYAPPVHIIKLTQEPEITPYAWVHPDEDDRG